LLVKIGYKQLILKIDSERENPVCRPTLLGSTDSKFTNKICW